MLSNRSSTTVCQECGKRNAGSARFCSACAARLGAEPSIGAGAGAGALPPDSRPDSRPGALQAPAADTGAFWVKLCIGALVVLLGVIGWALYMVTGSKVPAPLPAGAGTAAPEAIAPPPPPAATAPPPPPPPPVATAPPAAPPSATPPPAPRVAAEAVPPSDVFPYKAPAAQQRRSARLRPAPAEADSTAGEAPSGAWVMPSRPPAVTSSPGYRDEGPPIVPGPGPSVSDPATAGTAPSASDPGPPAALGPGPRYDFSTPGARGR